MFSIPKESKLVFGIIRRVMRRGKRDKKCVEIDKMHPHAGEFVTNPNQVSFAAAAGLLNITQLMV